MLYNVHYEVAATVFMIIVYIYLWVLYSEDKPTTNVFRRMVLWLVITNVLDVLTAIDISYAYMFPRWLNQLANTLYFASAVWLIFTYFQYTRSLIGAKMEKWQVALSYIVIGLYMCVMVLNLFFGLIFTFTEDGQYVHGPLYLCVYILSFVFLLASWLLIFINRKDISTRKKTAILFFGIMEVLGCTLQLVVCPQVLLSNFGASIATIIILFSMETPDYKNLVATLSELELSKAELENAKAEAEIAKNEAEAANVAKSAFLASMSHEIRTPINGVLGMNSIILKEAKNPKILEYSRNIDNAGNGLLSLINDILDFSKIESGKMDIVPVKYELSSVLAECYNMVFMRAQEKNLDLLFENNVTIPNELYGDEVRVRQIITNLLTNAIKYTAEGIVVLTADWEKVDEDNMVLIISVKDTGIGISKDNMDKLFTAFERIDTKRNRNIEGTGLGLKITKQFLELMGGTISVESEYGAGSEFTVRIPQKVCGKDLLGDFANYSHVSKNGEPVGFRRFHCPKGKVLVVDDVELNIKVIRGLLKDSDLHIDSALSGEECLAKIMEETYDVILLDHMMPVMDGIETFNKMKEMENFFNLRTPVIMLTANAISGAKEEYLNAGFTDYLSKPVREQELNEMMIKYLPRAIVTIEDGTNPSQMNTTVELQNPEVLEVNKEALSEFEKRFSFLDVKSGMNYCLNNEEFYESIIREFRSSNKYEEIQESYDEADLNNYAVLVHAVKSTSLTIGAPKVSEMAKALEFAAKAEDVEFLRNNHYDFMRAYGELLDNLDEVYA